MALFAAWIGPHQVDGDGVLSRVRWAWPLVVRIFRSHELAANAPEWFPRRLVALRVARRDIPRLSVVVMFGGGGVVTIWKRPWPTARNRARPEDGSGRNVYLPGYATSGFSIRLQRWMSRSRSGSSI